MSHIERLIAELCPNGVEFVPLRTTGRRNKGTRITAAQMKALHVDGGPVRIFAGGETTADVSYEAIPRHDIVEEPSIIVKSRGFIGFTYYDKPFSHKAEIWSYTITSTALSDKFLYYYLLTQASKLQALARSKSVKLPQLTVGDTDNLLIPLPPMEVQREIVRILDNFSQLEAELEAELEARRKQYEFYRNQLLTFREATHTHTRTRWMTLADIAEYSRGRVRAEDLDETNFVGVDNLLQDRRGRVDATYRANTAQLTAFAEGDILLGNIRPYLKKIWRATHTGGCSGDVLAIRILDSSRAEITSKYLYQVLASDRFFAYNNRYSKGAKMPRGDKAAILRFPIPLPPLQEQERIVEILDKFDALVNDLSIGLPAELQARRKQYEYYRDRLLTFEEINA